MFILKGVQKGTMEFHKEIDGILEDIKDENKIFQAARDPGEEIEALKEMLDEFLRGAQRVREYIDRYNDRRWQR